MKPTNIKKLQWQSRKLHTKQVDRHTFAVESISNPLAHHIVTVVFKPEGVHARCTCPWALNHGVACTHVMAALEHLAALKGRKLSFWSTREEAQRQRQRVFYLWGNGRDEGIWITSRAA